MSSVILLLVLGMNTPAAAPSDGRIYGIVYTSDGRELEGMIRWDANEVSWADVLDGSKAEHAAGHHLRLFGIRINIERDHEVSSKSSGIRFGHVSSLRRDGSNRAILTLRSGEEIVLAGGSTDIGTDNRGIVVEDGVRGQVTLKWNDLHRIDFKRAPANLQSVFGKRLSGTLHTKSGETYRGSVTWDFDEVFDLDVLDGEDADGREHEIPFREIKGLSWESERSARVTLRSGGEIVLSGTNDVNNENRGILVLDPAIGQIKCSWEAFESIAFDDTAVPIHYNEFNGSAPLVGVAEMRDGSRYEGSIKWDDDETYAWELLDGRAAGVDFQIELGLVREVRPLSGRTSEVVMHGGRVLKLEGSNDVNSGNDGVTVLGVDAAEKIIPWSEVASVVFRKP